MLVWSEERCAVRASASGAVVGADCGSVWVKTRDSAGDV